jgi:hypothetical protein
LAGKTGTAQDYTNVYFAGYTPQIATAVWVGFPQGQIPMDSFYGHSVFGGTLAAPIWHSFMSRALQGMSVEQFPAPPPPERGKVPDVVGLHSEDAQAKLVDANFTPIVEKVDSFEPVNTVIAQTPGAGASAVLGSAVKIEVSNGKGKPVTVPRVTGLTKTAAVNALDKAGLVAQIRFVDVNEHSQDGIVIAQSPIGDGTKQVDEGATVNLDVGRYAGEGNGPTGSTGGSGPSGPNGNGNGNGNGGGNGNGDGNGGGTGNGGGNALVGTTERSRLDRPA